MSIFPDPLLLAGAPKFKVSPTEEAFGTLLWVPTSCQEIAQASSLSPRVAPLESRSCLLSCSSYIVFKVLELIFVQQLRDYFRLGP